MTSKPKEAVDIVFDGKKLSNWFIYDRQVLLAVIELILRQARVASEDDVALDLGA